VVSINRSGVSINRSGVVWCFGVYKKSTIREILVSINRSTMCGVLVSIKEYYSCYSGVYKIRCRVVLCFQVVPSIRLLTLKTLISRYKHEFFPFLITQNFKFRCHLDCVLTLWLVACVHLSSTWPITRHFRLQLAL